MTYNRTTQLNKNKQWDNYLIKWAETMIKKMKEGRKVGRDVDR